MSRAKRIGDLEIFEVPDGVAQVAYNRTKDMMRWWANSGSYDLVRLVISAYLQGVEDGYNTKEHQLKKETSNV